MQFLFWALQALPYVAAFAAAVLVLVLSLMSYRHFGFGVGFIALTFWVEAATQSSPILQLGIRLFAADLPFMILGMVTATRWAMARDVPWRHPGWLLYVAVFMVNLAYGLATQGTAAGVQARGDFYAVVAASYAMSFPVGREQVKSLLRSLFLLVFGLVMLTAYRWVVYYTPITDLLPYGGTYNMDGPIRVIGAQHGLVLAQAVLLGLYFAHLSGAGGALRVLMPIVLGLVVALQHRSVWLAGMVGVVVGLMLARAERMPLWQQLVGVGALVLMISAGVLFSGKLGDSVVDAAERAATGQGSVTARFDNWRATLTDWRTGGARNLAIGRPIGTDNTRVITDSSRTSRIKYGAHNNYVSQLVGVGIVGFVGLAWAVVSILHGLIRICRTQAQQADWAALLLMLLCVQLAYYIAYSADYLQYMLLGVGLSAAALGRTSKVERVAAIRYESRIA